MDSAIAILAAEWIGRPTCPGGNDIEMAEHPDDAAAFVAAEIGVPGDIFDVFTMEPGGAAFSKHPFERSRWPLSVGHSR
ncbi:hypothetical protein LWX53_11950, partial [bacterium]|nr:hypothetical protein [bacterium]